MILTLCNRGPSFAAPGRQHNTQQCRPRGGPVWFRERTAPDSNADATIAAAAPATPQEKEAQHAAKRTATAVSSRFGAILSHPRTQAAACSALGVAAASAAAAALSAPVPLSGWLFGLTTPAAASAAAPARVAGATLLTTAAVSFVLREAASRRQLFLPTFRRLAAAAMLAGALGLTVLAQAGSVRTPQLAACAGGLYGGAFLLAARLYSLNKGGFPLPDVRATAAAAAALFVPHSAVAAAYAGVAALLAAAAVTSLATAPGTPSPLWGANLEAPAVFWARTAGAGLALQAVAAYCLKDAADRQVSGATPFRWLNLGLAAGLLASVTACGGAAAAGTPAGQGVLLLAHVAACGFVVLRYCLFGSARVEGRGVQADEGA